MSLCGRCSRADILQVPDILPVCCVVGVVISLYHPRQGGFFLLDCPLYVSTSDVCMACLSSIVVQVSSREIFDRSKVLRSRINQELRTKLRNVRNY